MLPMFKAFALALLLCSGAGAHAAPDPMVEEAQRRLAERGFDPGRIDGKAGWRTRAALRSFQRSAGLLDTGRIDDATRKALGLKPLAAARPAPEAQGEEAETEESRDDPAPGGGTDAPQATTQPGEPEHETDTGAPQAAQRDEPAPEADAGTPEAETARAEPVRTPAPAPAADRRLSFAALGWHPPQTGTQALARFRASDGTSPEIQRGEGTLVVPKPELVFVLKANERIPGFDCDPGAGRLSIEFIFGPDGPIIFTPLADGGYCRMGFGIALETGRTLEMQRADWGDTRYPRGTVRITDRGLERAN